MILKLRYLISILFAIFISANISAISKNKTTPDLALFELKGPVKSVSKGFLMGGIDDNGCTFNKKGQIIKINKPKWINYSGVSFSRNKNGYIYKTSGVPSGDEDLHTITHKIKYGPNGKPQNLEYYYEAERQTITDIKYNNHLILGYLAIEEYTYEEEPPTYIAYSFNYTKFDKYGNWTSRIATKTIYKNRFSYEHMNPESSESEVQTRIIKYYQ